MDIDYDHTIEDHYIRKTPDFIALSMLRGFVLLRLAHITMFIGTIYYFQHACKGFHCLLASDELVKFLSCCIPIIIGNDP